METFARALEQIHVPVSYTHLLGFAAFVSVIAVVSGGALFIGWKRRPESERLRYLALIGLYLVSFFMTFAYTESFIRFLGLAPFRCV